MASVYILFSPSINQFYIGNCKDLDNRLNQHLLKEVIGAFTANANDWVLFFSINQLEYEQARKIENHIKKMKSRKYIENLKSYPEISEKLVLKYHDLNCK